MKAVVLVSGGLDSVTALRHLAAIGMEVSALSFNYGQRNSQNELRCAAWHARAMGVPWTCVDLRCLAALLPGNPITDLSKDVVRANYKSAETKGMVVPNRNMVLLSIAAAHAMAIGAGVVSHGIQCGEGETAYADTREVFLDAMQEALNVATFTIPVTLCNPLGKLTKVEVVQCATELGTNAIQTWSCYENGHVHCGKCGACTKRREAYVQAGIEDPTTYAE